MEVCVVRKCVLFMLGLCLQRRPASISDGTTALSDAFILCSQWSPDRATNDTITAILAPREKMKAIMSAGTYNKWGAGPCGERLNTVIARTPRLPKYDVVIRNCVGQTNHLTIAS